MFDIALEDLLYVACALVGGALLLLTVLADDLLGPIIEVDVGGVSVLPLLLAFACLFGVGGLFATHALDAHGVQAAIAAAGTGVVGMGVTFLLAGLVRRAGD